MPRDYYDVLGVAKNSSKDEIKKAFRGLARKYHPDVSEEPMPKANSKKLTKPTMCLSDDAKRQRYDRFGHAGVQGASGGYSGGGRPDSEVLKTSLKISSAALLVVDVAEEVVAPVVVAIVQVDVTLDFEEAAFGVEKDLEFDRLEFCDVCDGSGARDGSHPTTCPECNGQGEVRQVRQTFVGSVVRVTTCPRCGGKGQIIEDPCTNCDGNGRVKNGST